MVIIAEAAYEEAKEFDQRMVELGIFGRQVEGGFLVPFDKARDSLSREIFLHVLEWDMRLAEVEPVDPEMLQSIEDEPKLFFMELEPRWAPELDEIKESREERWVR